MASGARDSLNGTNGTHTNGSRLNGRRFNGNQASEGKADRTPPFNPDAEIGVIGSIMLDPAVLTDVAEILEPDDFFRASHRELYLAIKRMGDEGRPIDLITVKAELDRLGQFEALGGFDAFDAACAVPHPANAVYYANIVFQLAQVRNTITTCNLTLEECYAKDRTADDLIDGLEKRIIQITNRRPFDAPVSAEFAANEALEELVRRKEGRPLGVPTGFVDIDSVLCALPNGAYVIIAGRPSQGKTQLGLQIGFDAASRLRVPVFFVSLEMSRTDLMFRLMSMIARVDNWVFKKPGDLNGEHTIALGQAAAHISQANLFIDHMTDQTIFRIARKARRMKARENIGLMIIDYLGLVSSEKEDEKLKRQEEVTRISRRLKNLAKELAIPVVLLCQLNREPEKRKDKRPEMADLRESGSLEQDADIVMLLHRPEHYKPNDQPGIAYVDIVKNRNGPTKLVKLAFLKSFTRFDNLSNKDDF